MCAALVSACLPYTYAPFARSSEPSASPTASSQDPRFYEFVFESDEDPTVKTRTDSVNVRWPCPKIATFSCSPHSATPEPQGPPPRPLHRAPASSLRLAHYASPCGGLTCVAVMPPPAGCCVFLIGRNTSSVTSVIVGLTAAAPNRPAPGAVPGGNALVTTAMH